MPISAQQLYRVVVETADQIEAMTLAVKFVVLDGGGVQRVGSLLGLYHQPANRLVAGFTGSPWKNFLEVSLDCVTKGKVVASGSALDSVHPSPSPGETLTLGIRPHALTLSNTGPIEGTVDLVECLGNKTTIGVALADGTT